MWWTLRCMHAMIGYCPWSICGQYMYMQTHRWHHSRISFFVSSNVAHGFENLKCKWRPWVNKWEMFSGGCFASKQKLRHWDRKRFWLLELSKLKKNSQKLASCVMALKLLYFWKVFLQLLFCFKQVKPFKHFGKKLSSRIREKRINGDEKNYCYFVAWKCLN